VRGDVRYRILIELAVGGCRIGACVGVLAGCRVRGRRLTVGSRGGIGVLGIRGRRLTVGFRGMHGIGIRGIAVVRILGGASCIRRKWDPIRHYNCGFLCCVQCHAYPGEDADKECDGNVDCDLGAVHAFAVCEEAYRNHVDQPKERDDDNNSNNPSIIRSWS